jgi:hypothetical protein
LHNESCEWRSSTYSIFARFTTAAQEADCTNILALHARSKTKSTRGPGLVKQRQPGRFVNHIKQEFAPTVGGLLPCLTAYSNGYESEIVVYRAVISKTHEAARWHRRCPL